MLAEDVPGCFSLNEDLHRIVASQLRKVFKVPVDFVPSAERPAFGLAVTREFNSV
jgi:hypothetical protein